MKGTPWCPRQESVPGRKPKPKAAQRQVVVVPVPAATAEEAASGGIQVPAPEEQAPPPPPVPPPVEQAASGPARPGVSTSVNHEEVQEEMLRRAAATAVPTSPKDVPMTLAGQPAAAPALTPAERIRQSFELWDAMGPGVLDNAKRARIAAVSVTEKLDLDTVDEHE